VLFVTYEYKDALNNRKLSFKFLLGAKLKDSLFKSGAKKF
jgi:hypothetical protein